MNEENKQDMKIYAYHYTIDKISDILTECKNFNNLEWCENFGCEYYQICIDIHNETVETLKKMVKEI